MQMVLVFGVAVPGAVRFDAWDGVHVAACAGRATCASCCLAVAGAVRLIVLDGVHVATRVGRTLMFFVGVAVADGELDVVAGLVQFVRRDVLQDAACMA